MSPEPIEPVRLACEAMATRFEILVHDDRAVAARAAGEAALREIVQLEDPLSFYRPAGALGRVNREAARSPVRVPAPLFELLDRCRMLHAGTLGAFDPTVGTLMRAWGLAGGDPRIPEPDELAGLLQDTGMAHVRLDAATRSVRYGRPGLTVDLGGVAKGFAIDEAMATLTETGIGNALLHGGTSTIRGAGPGPDGTGWRVGIPWPRQPVRTGTDSEDPVEEDPEHLSAVVTLRDESLSVSEPAGKGIFVDDEFHGHVVDPRTGRPVRGALLAAVAGPSATDTDALATALLVLGREVGSVPLLGDDRFRWLVAWREHGTTRFLHRGLPPASPDA